MRSCVSCVIRTVQGIPVVDSKCGFMHDALSFGFTKERTSAKIATRPWEASFVETCGNAWENPATFVNPTRRRISRSKRHRNYSADGSSTDFAKIKLLFTSTFRYTDCSPNSSSLAIIVDTFGQRYLWILRHSVKLLCGFVVLCNTRE